MARVYITTGNISICYTIDGAVGTGCANKRDDVLLVQFFLKVISRRVRRQTAIDLKTNCRSKLTACGDQTLRRT